MALSEDEERKEKKACIPTRAVLGALLFFISAASYMHGSNLGVIIVNMVVPPNSSIVGDPQCLSGNITSVKITPLPTDGVVYPAMHAAIARGTFGTMITFPLCGVIMDEVGWDIAFYFTAAFMLVTCLAWFFLMHDTPEQHPHISKQELKYIQESIGMSISKTELKFPAKEVFTSMPVFILVLLHIGDVWGWRIGSTSLFKQIGIWRTLQCYYRFHPCQTNHVPHLVPAVFLFLVGVAGCSPYISVACLTLSLGFNGASVGSCLANPHDLAPNFAGLIAGAVTHEKSGLKEWQIIWGLGGGVYVLTAISFFIWGTGERQQWNEPLNKPQQQNIEMVHADELSDSKSQM
ncbi:hypothetical protein C0J52_05440 [Blattella germanica]|nr:hypothetical protein C0J52_05440 [Blattella germanica]